MPSKRIPKHIELEYIKLSRLTRETSHNEDGVPSTPQSPAEILQNLLKRDRWRSCATKIVFTLGFLILIGGFGMLVIFGVLYAQSYGYTLDFIFTKCNVTLSNITGTVQCDECKYYIGDCVTKYPCLEIIVDYKDENGEVIAGAHLYESHYSLRNQRGENMTNTSMGPCTYYICYKDQYKNERLIHDFQEEYGNPGDAIDCYYNRKDPTEVIKGRISRLTVIISMAFAGITIVTGASLSVFMYVCFCRR